MTKQGESIKKITTKTAMQWKLRAQKDRSNRKNISRAQKFALELLDYLEENKITQKQLAQKMDVSPQQVNKILRAKANLTFETLDKIEAALGVTLSSPTIISKIKIQSKTMESIMILVHKSDNKQIEENYSTSIVTRKNPILETTLESIENYAYTAEQI